MFLFEKMLIGERKRYLCFHLNQLVLHIGNHLPDHLLRIFSFIDQVV